jgi:hypothetical protein
VLYTNELEMKMWYVLGPKENRPRAVWIQTDAFSTLVRHERALFSAPKACSVRCCERS